jgi:hypothetical protein
MIFLPEKFIVVNFPASFPLIFRLISDVAEEILSPVKLLIIHNKLFLVTPLSRFCPASVPLPFRIRGDFISLPFRRRPAAIPLLLRLYPAVGALP